MTSAPPQHAAPRIVSVETALPPHVLERDEVKRHIPAVYGATHDAARLTEIVERSAIDRRYLVEPAERFLERRGLGERNDAYIRHSRELGERAARAALAAAGVRPDELDIVLSTSCTGFAIPSLEAHLANVMGMRRDVRRVPITELGCAGGAAAIGRASEFLRAFPDAAALVVAVEIPSLTFQPFDAAMANVVSSFIFGDGAAAIVLVGAERARRSGRAGAEVLATRSCLFPDTLGYMGFDLRDTGFHIVLSPMVPLLVRRSLGDEVAALLAPLEIGPKDLGFFALHPGGAKVIEAMADALDVPVAMLASSARVLAAVGNLSSASVMHVLRDAIETGPPGEGSLGLLGAMGPGFAAELALLRWRSA